MKPGLTHAAAAAILAVILAIWTWCTPVNAGGSRILTRWLALGRLALGIVWLFSVGLIYLIWPC